MSIRLQKFLADCNIGSRRKCETYILDGRVSVNGIVITELGTKIEENDIVYFDNAPVNIEKNMTYIMLNKPEGFVTTSKDQFNRKTVLSLLEDVKERVYPVGRLDYDTSGLLLITNDGDLTFKITHPKHHFPKTYIAKVYKTPSREKLNLFENGLVIDNYKTAKSKIRILNISGDFCTLEITIKEGKNRQIREMCSAIGHEVKTLKRVSIGEIHLGNLEKGNYRFLSPQEVNYLKMFNT